MAITVKEFKRFVAEIPETFDDSEIAYIDFSNATSLQCGLDRQTHDVKIIEWGADNHIYWVGNNDIIVKALQLRP